MISNLLENLALVFVVTLPITIPSFIFFALSKAICSFIKERNKATKFFCKNTIYIIIFIILSLSIMSFYENQYQKDNKTLERNI